MAIQDKATYIAQKNIDFANNTSQLITPTIQRNDRQNLAESLAWLSDANTYTGQQRFNKGADVASATVLPLISDGNYFDVTGTVTVTSFADLGGAGTVIILQFDAACILTHHATNLILPTGGNITTAAGDTAIFVNYASGDYRCLSYQRADGTPLVGGGDVTKVGTPVNNQVGVWTGDGTLEGDSKLTFDGTTLGVTGGGTFAGSVTITGANALRGSYGSGGLASNFAAGDFALYTNTTGSTNTAIGRLALVMNTEGIKNTATGHTALEVNTTGSSNTATGDNALEVNTIGDNNTANGEGALTNNTEGSNNTALGYQSGLGITTGSGNTVLGANVTGLAAGLTNNIILANGTGAIKAQHDGTDWAFTGRATFSSSVTTVSNAGYILNYTVDASSRSWVIKNDQSLFGDFQIQQSTTQTGTIRTTKFYISPSGNIGIGNSNDTYKLDVSGTANLTGALSGTSATFSGALSGTSASFSDNVVLTGSSKQIRLENSSFVNFTNTGNTIQRGYIQHDGTNLNIASPVGSIILSGGNVGIGTSSPRAKLNLEGGSTTSINATACWQYIGSAAAASYTSSNYMGVGFGYNNAGNSEAPAFIGFTVTDASASTNGALVFATRSVTTATAPTERLRITSAGDATFSAGVGINGATSTNGVLEVLKASSSIAQFSLGWNTSNHTDMYVDATGNFYIQPQGTTRLTISSTGAATFSSSVTANGGASGVGLRVVNNTNSRVIELGYSTGSGSNFIQAYDGSSFQPLVINNTLTLDSTGAATFSASVTSAANFISNSTTNTPSTGTSGANNATYNYLGYSGYWGIRTTATGNNFALDTYNGGTPKNALTVTQGGDVLIGTSTTPSLAGLAVGSTASGKNISVFSSSNGSNGVISIYQSNGTSEGQLYAGAGNVNFFGTSVVKIVASTGGVQLTSGATSWTSISDERTKDIIEPISNAVQKVSNLRSVIGKYKTDSEGTRRSFLIAQDVQAVFPEAVDTTDEDNLGVRYTETIPLLVAAIKEQQAIIEDLKTRIEQLEL
jgi:hypothetical protein